MVGSSVIAAWADISTTLARMSTGLVLLDPTSGADVPLAPRSMIGSLNVGYMWMFFNCVASAAYVSFDTRYIHWRKAKYAIGSFYAETNKNDRFQRLGFYVL
jgi:hypothetical protein